MKAVHLKSGALCLSMMAMQAWLVSCSKSDAATIAADESIVQGNHNDHDSDSDSDSDSDDSDGDGVRRSCRRHGHGPRKCTTVDSYDTFTDATTYDAKWISVSDFIGNEEPEARSSRAFGDGRLSIEANPFVTSSDHVLDHMKYFAISTRSYEVPLRGSVEVSADIRAFTPGAVHNRRNQTTNRRLTEGQQAAATLELIDTGDTGVRLAWYVSQNRAFALYERTTLDGACDLDRNYTQIVQEFAISPGTHTFAIRYLRNTGAHGFGDKVGWILDGHFRAEARNVGVPITHRNQITYPAQGAGERLDTRLNRFNVGHGIASMVDEFPFNQCATGQVSIPASDRIFGQGVTARWDNFQITTEDL